MTFYILYADFGRLGTLWIWTCPVQGHPERVMDARTELNLVPKWLLMLVISMMMMYITILASHSLFLKTAP